MGAFEAFVLFFAGVADERLLLEALHEGRLVLETEQVPAVGD